MKTFKTALHAAGLGILALAALLPFILIGQAWHQEIWLVPAIQELHEGYRLVPTLNHQVLPGYNPLPLLLAALIPGSSLMGLRLFSAVLGALLVAGTAIFASRMINRRSAVMTTLITITSFGFYLNAGTVNAGILPVMMVFLSYLIFCDTYLREGHGGWYILSYLLMSVATLAGGWILLGFFVCAILALLLFDLTPKRFLEIKPLAGAGIFLLLLIIFALVYRIAGGEGYIHQALSSGEHAGFWSSLSTFVKATLPWLPLIIPAWIYCAAPEDDATWRALLPAKIVFILTLLMLLFSPGSTSAMALFAVPSAALLIGCWMAAGCPVTSSRITTHLCILLCGALIFATALVSLGADAIRTHNLSWQIITSLVILAALLVTFLVFVRSRRYARVMIACLVGCIVGSSCTALLTLPDKIAAPHDFVAGIKDEKPLIVFEDDLPMRGHLALAGETPIVVARNVVPLGSPAYLAVSAKKIKPLKEDLALRMSVEELKTFGKRPTLALMRIAPLGND